MTWQGKGSTRAWRKQRARVLQRDGRVCQIGGPKCTGLATQVHHKLGRGVSESDDDLEAACQPCNNGLGSPEASGLDPLPKRGTAW